MLARPLLYLESMQDPYGPRPQSPYPMVGAPVPASRPKSRAGIVALVLFGLMMLGSLGLGAAIAFNKIQGQEAVRKSLANGPPEIDISAEKLSDAYQADEASAKATYDEKVITVRGEVSLVQPNAFKDFEVYLKAGRSVVAVVDQHTGMGMNMKRGSQLALDCHCVGKVLLEVKLDACRPHKD